MRMIILTLLLGVRLYAEELGGVEYSLQGKWQVAENYKTDEQELVSYLPEGEDQANWSELFTVQTVKQFNKDPAEFFKLFVEQLKILAPGKNLQTKILQPGEKDFFAEWWIDDKSSQDQHEWIRLVNNKGDLVVVRFTTRQMDKIDDARQKAEKMIFKK